MNYFAQQSRTEDYRYSSKMYRKCNAKKRSANSSINRSHSFLNQNVEFSDYLYLPEKQQGAALLCYLVALPYVTGALVIYLFIAQRDISSFLAMDLFTVIPVWSIGYETLAFMVLLMIGNAAIKFQIRKSARVKKEIEMVQKRRYQCPSSADILKNYSY